ncbi:MAG TPA: hypothetical protein VM450_01675 [Thermomicrobiales bacterium]|nr:hypothetical protein [Thermomicrobiales bacterium]
MSGSKSNAFDGLSRSLAHVSSRRQALKLIGGGLAGGFVAAKSLSSATAQTGGGLVFPVDFTSALGSFTGSFDVTRFAVQQGQVVAIGTLTGTVSDALGNVLGTVSQALTLPLDRVTSFGTCEVLHLELGPLDLNLLGLVVHLDRIVLDITAEQGALLGDLLCAVANLLNGGNANALSRLLNQVLRLLG